MSSLSGDARRALDISRRATEIAQRHQERKKAEASNEAAANKVKKSGAKKSASYHHEDEAENESVVGMIHVTQVWSLTHLFFYLSTIDDPLESK